MKKELSNFYSPTPDEWKEVRVSYQLTQEQAAFLVRTTLRTVQRWESGESKIPPMAWELFNIKLKYDLIF